MNQNFHINVNREDPTVVRVAVADEDGNVIAVEEFSNRPDGKGSKEFQALAWTMGVLLQYVAPGQGRRWRGQQTTSFID